MRSSFVATTGLRLVRGPSVREQAARRRWAVAGAVGGLALAGGLGLLTAPWTGRRTPPAPGPSAISIRVKETASMTSARDRSMPVVNATRARQGRWGRHIFWVLVFGTPAGRAGHVRRLDLEVDLGRRCPWARRAAARRRPPGQRRAGPAGGGARTSPGQP